MVGQEVDSIQLSTVLKVLSIVSGLGTMGIGFAKLASFDFAKFLDIMLAIYFVIFGIMMVIMELPCPKLLVCFSFLGYYLGKALFLLFVGTLMFGWEWYEIMLAIALFIASCLYFVMVCLCKDKLFDRDENGNRLDENGNPISDGTGEAA